MSSSIKLRASVVSYKGTFNISNQNGFFLDGNSFGRRIKDNMEVSVEKDAKEYMFSVYSGMNAAATENEPTISVMRDLARLQEELEGSRSDVDERLDKMNSMLEELDNLLYSRSLNNTSLNSGETGFSGLLIQGDKAGVLSAGNCSTYLLRGGELKIIAGNTRRAGKMPASDDIASEQSVHNTGEHKNNNNDRSLENINREVIEIVEDDILLLCNKELIEVLQEQKIKEILAKSGDSASASNSLAEETLAAGAKADVTALVVMIDEINDVQDMEEEEVYLSKWSDRLVHIYDKKQEVIRSFIAAALTCIVLAAVIISTYKILSSASDIENPAANQVMGTKSTSPKTVVKNQQTGTAQNSTTTAPQSTNAPSATATTQKPAAITGSSNSEGGAGNVIYEVQKGDTLGKIAQKYYKDANKVKPIMEKNNITDPNKIKVGQKLIIP